MRNAEDAQRVRDARDDAEADAPSTTLPNGLRYREYVAGEVGEEAMKGSRVDARYKVFRLSAARTLNTARAGRRCCCGVAGTARRVETTWARRCRSCSGRRRCRER